MPREISSVIVLPIKVAPASSSRWTAQACRAGTGFERAQSGLPPPVGWPATSNRSLAAKVRPESGPPGRPSIRTRGPGTNALTASSDIETSGRSRNSGFRAELSREIASTRKTWIRLAGNDLQSSCAGLTRVSTSLFRALEGVDGRTKPGQDEIGEPIPLLLPPQ